MTHLHLGSLGRGRGSSLDWARLPLTSCRASGAGLHCLHLHTQHALFIYLYLLPPPPHPTSPSLPHRLPPMILSRICLLLLLYFSVKPLALLSPLVCLSDKADSNWKLSVFTIPQWLPGCRHTSALKQRHTHTHTSHLLFLLSCLVLVQLKEDLIHLSCRSCSAR